MPFQTVEEGLVSQQESVVSKKDLIRGVINSLKQQQLDDAANMYRRSKEDIGYELMNFAGRGELAKPLADVFLQTKDFYKGGPGLRNLGHKEGGGRELREGRILRFRRGVVRQRR